MFEWRPDYKQSLFNLGMSCYKRKDYDKSQYFLNKLHSKDEYFKPLEIYERLGDIEIKKHQDWGKAKSLYEKVIGTSVVYHLLIKIGKCWENLNEYEKALASYKKSLDGHANYIWGLFHIGCLLTKMDEGEEGLTYLKRAYKHDKTNVDVIIKYTQSLIKKGGDSDLELALEILSRARETNKNNMDIYINISKIYDCWNNTHDAIQAMEEAHRAPNFSSDPDKVYSLAMLYEKAKSFPKAIQLYKNVLALKKDHTLALCRLGSVFSNAKDYKRAAKYFKFAYRNDKKCFMATYGLGKIANNFKKTEKAIDYFNKTLEINNGYFK
jgi:protein O-GlcNAc transferase